MPELCVQQQCQSYACSSNVRAILAAAISELYLQQQCQIYACSSNVRAICAAAMSELCMRRNVRAIRAAAISELCMQQQCQSYACSSNLRGMHALVTNLHVVDGLRELHTHSVLSKCSLKMMFKTTKRRTGSGNPLKLSQLTSM